MSNEQSYSDYAPLDGSLPFTPLRADIKLWTDRREARRLPILTEREAAILICGRKRLPVRLLDESAYGLLFFIEKKHDIEPGRKLEMITVAGRFEVLVVRAEGDGDDARIAVRILREIAPPASRRLSSVALFLLVLFATTVLVRTVIVIKKIPVRVLPSAQAPAADQQPSKQPEPRQLQPRASSANHPQS